MLQQRYNQKEKLITRIEELKIIEESYVEIYKDEEVCIDLEDRVDEFEQLKEDILIIAKSLSKLDYLVQQYSERECFFEEYELSLIYLQEKNRIELDYWGIKENTQFSAIFERKENCFFLKKFGCSNKDISEQWSISI